VPFAIMLFRSDFYEVVAKLHLLAAAVLLTAVWIHLGLVKSQVQSYLKIGLFVLAGTNGISLVRLLWRNYGRGQRTVAYVQKEDDALIITLDLSRPWTFRPGQYVNLCIPRASFWSVLQWHPYMISWWTDADANGPLPDADLKDSATASKGPSPPAALNGTARVKLLVRPAHGFTRFLEEDATRTTQRNAKSYRAWVDGPLGYAQDFSEYAHVLLIAEATGIAAQLPIVKDLVERRLTTGVRTRKITLAWQLEHEGEHLVS
jgi:FAD-binding domain